MRPQSSIRGLILGARILTRRSVVILTSVAAIFIGAATLHAENDTSKLFQEARRNFKPVTDHQVADARAEVRDRMDDVADFVDPSTENGKSWLHYLRWDALKDAVAEQQPKSLEPFDKTIAQLTRNEVGLENPHFRHLASALREYRDLLAVSMWDQPLKIYDQQLDALQHDLEAYQQKPSPHTEQALSERLHIVDSIGQAPKLVAAIRSEVAKPNALMSISTSLIAAAAGPVDRTEPVTDCILGTNVHSQTHTTGTVNVVSIPSHDKAVLMFYTKGHTWSDSTGFNGPAVICSTSDTDFTAKKRVELSDAAFRADSARADATTDLHIHSVSKQGGGLGSRLVSRIGWSRAQGSRCQAEAIAADHAEGRIEGHFNDELDDQVHDARKRYEDEYRIPLERRDEVPDNIRFSSTKRAVAFEVTQASRSQLGAASNPPAVPEAHDVAMQLHESAVENYSASILGGATARQTKPNEDVQFNVHLPKWMNDLWKNRKTEPTHAAGGKEEPFKQFALTFQEKRPISVDFAHQKIKLTVHIAHLKSGDKTFDDWDVTGTYDPTISDGKVVLNREGDLVMLPANFRGQLSSRQVAERRNLEEELNRRSDEGQGFPKSIRFEPVKPSGKLGDAGPLNFDRFTSDDGWLIVGLDRQKTSK
jgi:hypothetical protein